VQLASECDQGNVRWVLAGRPASTRAELHALPLKNEIPRPLRRRAGAGCMPLAARDAAPTVPAPPGLALDQTRKSPARRIGTPIPVPGQIGNRGLPVSRPNRESGIPSPIPQNRESGDPIPDSRVPVTWTTDPSAHQPQWTRNIYSAASIMPMLSGTPRAVDPSGGREGQN
jgi:hypothetical protein